MTYSVSLLSRLRITINGIRKHISKVSGGREVHSNARADFRSGFPIAIDNNGYKAEPDYPVHQGELGNQVCEVGRNVVLNNFELGFTYKNLAELIHSQSPVGFDALASAGAKKSSATKAKQSKAAEL